MGTLRCTTLYHATHAYIRLPHKLLQVRVLGGERTAGRLAMKECLGENGRRGKKGSGRREKGEGMGSREGEGGVRGEESTCKEGGRESGGQERRERGGRRDGGRRVIICMHLYLAIAWTVLHISPI